MLVYDGVDGVQVGKGINIEDIGLEKEVVDLVKSTLVYVRDRVGVPRDMSVHAAKQFRSHINLSLDGV